jgi:predicted enzyme related to lactoylglutathione lyase
MKIEKIGQVSIPVKDVDRALAFYRDVLGLTFLFRAGDKLAFVDCGGVRIALSIAEEGEFDHASSILYFTVSDIHASWQDLAAAGVEALREPHVIAKLGTTEVWMAFFRDTERNVHALMSEVG